MSSFIRKKKTKSGATAIQIIHKRGRIVTGLKHIGTAHNDAELEMLLALAHEKMHEGQLSLDFGELSKAGNADLRLEKSYSALLWDTLSSVYDKLDFGCLGDPVFKQLVLARIIEPTSKLDTIRVLEDLGLDAPSNSGIHRCLRDTNDEGYRERLSEACFRHVKPATLRLVLYDVTTLYFEIQKEDEYRKSGLSKERKLEPQITVGLLVDRTGFPLEIQSFEGNCAEVKTLLPVLAGFKERHGLKDVTVTERIMPNSKIPTLRRSLPFNCSLCDFLLTILTFASLLFKRCAYAASCDCLLVSYSFPHAIAMSFCM